ncbi:hypothetical protein [Blastopirellula marina]|uniref:J domain-containing protein n=1 Tax=Blastopirellula marina DSM 3645 TaxID=314230 RepID=A4A1N2_9BACT|nr:hypothetical protein [Blastopirellula marina]EAQ77337.1 hypothetical protein DSM3645_04790 [Blastopirellula marina DSM 3645]
MTDPNNPYYRWLGLSVYGRPDYYTLLGLRTFETDPQLISAQGEQAFLRVQTQHGGAEEGSRQQILQEITAARACLQNPAQKGIYDQQLQQYYAQYGGSQHGGAQHGGAPYGGAPYGGNAGYAPTAQPSQTNPMAPAGYPASQGVGYGAGPGGVGSTAQAAPSGSEAPVQVSGRGASTAKRAKSRAKGGGGMFWVSALLGLLLVGGAVGGFVVWQSNQQAQEVADADPVAPVSPVMDASTDVVELKKAKKPLRQPGKRPTAEELAGSIPGLGDPDERMEAMGEMPKPKPPVKPQPTATEKKQLQTTIETAWRQLAAKNFGAAQATLAGAASLNKTDQGEAEFQRVDQLAKNLVAFQKAIDSSLEKLQGGEQLQVGSTDFTVASKTATHLVLRVAGQSKSYELANLPEGLRRALALYSLAGDDAQKKLVEGSFLLFSDIADQGHAMDVWKAAAAQGADISSYIALADEKSRYAPSRRGAAPVMTSVEDPAATPESTSPAMVAEMNGESSPVIQLGQMLTAARQALVERRPDDAQRILAEATPLAELPAHQQKVARLQKLADQVGLFWAAVSEELAGLTADTDLTVGPTVARIVENRADYLVIRVNGENRRYTLADLPAGLAMHFATEGLADDDAQSKMIRGAYLLVAPKGGVERAAAMWDEAKQAGADLGDLPLVATDNYNLADDLLVQVAVPSDSSLTAATAQFQEKWATAFANAKRASDHTELAKKLLSEGKSIDDDAQLQFVTFRYALAEAAKGGELPLCNEIVLDWAKRFSIDPLEWDLKSYQLAAASEGALQQERVAKYALTLAPRLLKAGRRDEAVTVAETAAVAAKKARNKGLVEQVEQLQQSL